MDLGGVRAQPQMLWGEDLGPETPVDHPDIPQAARPESSQDVVDGSSDSDEEEWRYVSGNVKSADKEEKMDDPENDMKSQLNPNATEFVPGFPSVEKDEFIASSPNIGKVISKDLDDIVVPSESEFNRDIATKACELEAASDGDAINTSAEPSSRREIDFNYPSSEVKSDSVTLILSPLTNDNESPVTEEKVDTNPFAADIESNKGNTDHVNFVQDYFGTSEVDFKPFESVTTHVINEKVFDESPLESQIPNSVSAEISSHFNFIDSHLENSESERPEETEKERNQLEIKEPESPVNPEHLNNGIIDSNGQKSEPVTGEPVDKKSEVDLIADEFESHTDGFHPPETEVLQHEFNIEGIKVNIVTDMIAEASSEDLISDVDKVNIIESEDMFCFENREDIPVAVEVDSCQVSNEMIHDSFVKDNLEDKKKVEIEINSDLSKEFTSSIQKELLVTEEVPHYIAQSEHIEKEPVGVHDDFSCNAGDQNILVKTNDIYGYNDQAPDLPQDKPCHIDSKEIFNIDEFSNEDSEAKFINETEKIVSEILDVSSDSNQTEFKNIKEKEVVINDEEILQITDPSDGNKEFVNNHVDEIQPSPEVILDQDEMKESISNETDENTPQNTGATLELADTIGPNSFSFSQPHEVAKFNISGITALEFANRYGARDIMMTSMHESFEPDSSFEFINVSSVKESNIIEIDDKKEQDNISPVVPEPIHVAPDNSTKENGIEHIEPAKFIPPETEDVKTVLDTESVIVESREMPVSSEPDVVFVEQIYPTVEVSSDEATPISKENSSFDLATAAVTAAGVTVVAAGAAVLTSSLVSEEKQPELPIKEEVKAAEDTKAAVKTATKAPAAKKPAALGAKPPLSKITSTKAAPTKSSNLISAKPKAPAATKPTTMTTAKKPTSTTKPAVAAVSKTAPLSKPAVKTSVAPISKAPAKVPTMSAAKPASSATKPAPRPASAPTKSTAPLSAKPALSSRTTATAPRVPLAAKRPTTTTATTTASKPLAASRPASGSETKTSAKPAVPRTTSLTAAKPASPKTANTLGAKPPTKLGLSAAPTAKPKTTSPTKPAPIKAKAPLIGPKKSTTTAKKTSPVLDKNAKNAVKSVPKNPAQKEISIKDIKEEKEHTSSTTNGHHIENGNITPHEEIASPIII